MIRGLPATKSRVELGTAAGAEVCDLLGADRRDLTSTAGIGWVSLKGKEGGRGRGAREAERLGKGFVIEMVTDEERLKVRGVGVGRYRGEVKMAEVH